MNGVWDLGPIEGFLGKPNLNKQVWSLKEISVNDKNKTSDRQLNSISIPC